MIPLPNLSLGSVFADFENSYAVGLYGTRVNMSVNTVSMFTGITFDFEDSFYDFLSFNVIPSGSL